MQKSQKSTGSSTIFYKPLKEIHSGYLIKSPPSIRFKRWKRRYFVLLKNSNQEYQLEYFKSKEEREKCGKIELSSVSLLVPRPQEDQRWPWIQKNFNCPPSHVLYIETIERGYFLIGEDSNEMETWFSMLFDAMEERPHKVMFFEDIRSRQSTLEIGPKDVASRRSPNTIVDMQILKMRSSSDPCSNAADQDEEAQGKDSCKRRPSKSVSIYDHPAAFLRRAELADPSTPRRMSLDSVYESMTDIKSNGLVATAGDRQVEWATDGSPLKSVDEALHKLKSQVSLHEEAAARDRDNTCLASDLSSSSSENIANPPVDALDTPFVHTLDKQSSTESIDDVITGERDVKVERADLKKYLSITEVDGKPCVSGWTGQPQSARLFRKGDQILAINDLHVGSVEEFNMYLSKCLKNEVTVTIHRLHGYPPPHSPLILESD